MQQMTTSSPNNVLSFPKLPEQPNLTALIDERYGITRLQDELADKIAILDGEIMTLMLQNGEKAAYGTEGIGYSITSTTRYEFGKAAYLYLEDKDLIHHFVGSPKITKTKLDALIKEGELNYADMAQIEKWMSVEQSPYALRKVVDKKAQVK